MKHYLLAIFLCFSIISNAQIFAPPGAQWNYKFTPYGGSGILYIEQYSYVGDTLINGINCQKITGQSTNDLYLFYSDTNRIFYYNPVYNVFDKIFDYTLSFGDSILLHRSYTENWILPLYDFDSTYYTRVVDKGIDQFNGINYRWMYFYTPDAPNTYWHTFNGKYYEKLGFLDGHFTYQNEAFISVDGPNVFCLKNYTDLQLTLPVGGSNCFIPTAIDEQVESNFSIFPNPVTNGKFTIQSPLQIKNVQLINMLGQMVLTVVPMGNEVSIEGLSQGVYVARVEFADEKLGYKRIVFN